MLLFIFPNLIYINLFFNLTAPLKGLTSDTGSVFEERYFGDVNIREIFEIKEKL